jgi:hypothetical protein
MVGKHSEKFPSVGGGQLVVMNIITRQDEGYYKYIVVNIVVNINTTTPKFALME